MFEHHFPKGTDGNSVGMTTALTALSSAIESVTSGEGAPTVAATGVESTEFGPLHDSQALRTLAKHAATPNGSSWNPIDYWHCAEGVAKAVLTWIQHWGHLVLDILSQATFAPPPFTAIGVTAAATNATWYAVDGDYGDAGLSLAAAVPGLAITKVGQDLSAAAKAKAAREGSAAAVAAKARATIADEVSTTAKLWRPAEAKIKAIWLAGQKGNLKKTAVNRDGTSAVARYSRAGKTVPGGHDVDHTIDLQLGGIDDPSNMRPLDRAVNRSLGKQIGSQLRGLDYGTLIPSVAICAGL